MPSYVRIAADNTVEAICLSRPTRIQTPFGALDGNQYNWLVTDYRGAHALYNYDDFKAKFDGANQAATDYLNANKPAPILDQLQSTSGPIGSTVYLGGNYFNAAQGNGKVYFGVVHPVEAVVTSWGMNEIAVTVPAGLPTSYDISIWVTVGVKVSNRQSFRVTV